MMIVHYEVYVLESVRGWILHARYPRQEKDSAIAEAKELEKSMTIPVKVLKETYYTDNNAFDEEEVYASGKEVFLAAKKAAATSGKGGIEAAAAAAPGRGGGKGRAAPRRPAGPPAKAHQLLGRLLVIVAIALAAALLAIRLTPDIILFLWGMGIRMEVRPDTYSQILFAVFVLTFLMVAVPLATKFLPRSTEIPSMRRAAKPAPRRDPGRERLKKSVDKLANQAMAEGIAAEEEKKKKQEDKENEAETAAQMAEAMLAEMKASVREDEEEPPPPPPPAEEAPPKPTPVPSLSTSPAPMSAHSAVSSLLDGAIASLRATNPVLPADTKFALHLYVAGAIETLAERDGLNDGQKADLLVGAISGLGTKGDMAGKFVAKLPEYLLEPRYMAMLKSGRRAMAEHGQGNPIGTAAVLKGAMTDWNSRGGPKKQSIITVMFTDMVGSTDLTQERGDAAAQEIVRRHNTIVRVALSQFGGKEIKHTGDGIMASFPSAADACEATVQIQKQVAAYNAKSPGNELHLRIGLNAGEPIQEEDDLFGTTVQLSARVCAATQTDQILCTGVVKELASGRALDFASAGEHKLKGFKDMMTLWEIRY